VLNYTTCVPAAVKVPVLKKNALIDKLPAYKIPKRCCASLFFIPWVLNFLSS
jgi:hypothetical protein